MKRRWAPSCRQAGSRQVAQLPHPRRSRSASTHLQQRAHGGHVGAPGAGQVLVRLAVAAVRVWVRQQRRQRGPLVLLLSQAAVGGGRQRRWRAWQRRRVGHWAEHDPHRFGVDQRRSAGAKAAAGAAQAAEARQQLGDAVQASFHVHSRGRPACVMLQGRCGCGKEVGGGRRRRRRRRRRLRLPLLPRSSPRGGGTGFLLRGEQRDGEAHVAGLSGS